MSHGSGWEQTQGGMFWGRKEGAVALQIGFCLFSVPFFVFSLQKRIAECQYWPVEVCRLFVALPSKGKTSKADKVKWEGMCCSGLWSSIVLLSIFISMPL